MVLDAVVSDERFAAALAGDAYKGGVVGGNFDLAVVGFLAVALVFAIYGIHDHE